MAVRNAGRATGPLAVLQIAAIAMFVASLLCGLLLPVYSDEVGWRLQARAGFDGVDKLYRESCGPNTLARPLFFMWPARYYSSFFNAAFADPFWVRVSGVLYALAWTGLLLVLVRRIASRVADRPLLTVVAIGLMALGTMPLLLVWSRPEQPLLLALTGALLIAWSDGNTGMEPSSAASAWRRSLAILALALVAQSYHVKGPFLAPVFLVCLFIASRGAAANLPRLLTAIAILGASAAAAHYWIDRLACPADALINAERATSNNGALLVQANSLTAVLPIVSKMFNNMNMFEYFGLSAPRAYPMSAWVRANQIGKEAAFGWVLALIVVWSISALGGLACFAVAAYRDMRRRMLDPRLLASGALMAVAMGWNASQAMRNVYEATFVLPLVMLSILLALAAASENERLWRWMKGGGVALGVLALASPPAIATIYGPSMLQAARSRGYVPGQPYSVPVFGYGAERPRIVAAARKCGIEPNRKVRALVIDDTTYFAFMQQHLPQHAIKLISHGGDPDRARSYLKQRGSGGAIVVCRWLDPEWRAIARQEGAYCCLGAGAW